MPTVQRTEFAPYSPRQMFELVTDVRSYPEFLPWCSNARVKRCAASGVVATLEVKKGPLHHSFTTTNTHHEYERIELRLLDGPFKQLQGMWRFKAVPGGCQIALDLDFEFSNRLLANALSKVFQMITASMVEAFQQRAQALYG